MRIGTIVFIAVVAFGFAVEAQAERGKAYVYPPDAEGETTASGEMYHHSGLTGGHAKLPFGTIVRVTDVWTGKAVDVRINDRRSHRSQLIRISRAAGEKLGIIQHGVADVTVQIVRPATPAESLTYSKQEKKPFGGLFASKGAENTSQSIPSHHYPETHVLSARTVPPPVQNVQNARMEPVLVPLAAPKVQPRFWLQFATFPDRKSAKEFAQLIKSRGAPTKVISDPNGLIHRVVSDHFFASRQEADAAADRTAKHVGFHSVVQGR